MFFINDESFGGRLGNSLGSGLHQLAQAKLQGLQQKVQHKQTAQGLEAMGYKPQEAGQLAGLSPELLKIALKSRSFGGGMGEPTSAEALMELIPGLSKQKAVAIAKANPTIQSLFYRHVLQNPEVYFGNESQPGQPQQASSQMAVQPQPNQMQPQMPGQQEAMLAQQQPMPGQPMGAQPEQQQVQPQQIQQPQRQQSPGEKLAEGLIASKQEQKKALTEKELKKELHQEKKSTRELQAKQKLEQTRQLNRETLLEKREEADKKKFERKDAVDQKKAEYQKSEDEKKHIEHAFKETKKYREERYKLEKSADMGLKTLERMQELNESGKLATPGYLELLKGVGLDIPTLMGADAEEFTKQAQSFLRGAKDQFGGNVTNFEAEQYLRQVPSLSQSPEGRQRVIANTQRFLRQDKLETDLMDKIIDDNGDTPPLNLDIQVRKALKNDDPKSKYYRYYREMKHIGDQFKQDLKRPVPTAQNSYVTALQATTGKILGTPGRILGIPGSIISKLAS